MEWAKFLGKLQDQMCPQMESPLVGRWARASIQDGKLAASSGEHMLEIEIRNKPNSDLPAFEGRVFSRGTYYQKKRPDQKSFFIDENEHYLTITLVPEASARTERMILKVEGLLYNNYRRP